MNPAFILALAALAAPLAPSPAAAAGDADRPARALARVLASPRFDAAKRALGDDHDRLVEEIIYLTEIPAPPFGEEARGKAFAELMRKSGFREVRIDGIGNVLATRRGTRTSLAPVVIAAHLDTVFPAGTDVKVRREGTKLMAPGIGDDTRGLAVLLAMARAMDKADIRHQRDIIFVGNVGEEGPGNLRGIRHLFDNDPRARAAAAFITVDSSGASNIATRGVGSRRYHIVFDGPGGHSYDKFGIVNPLVPLARTVAGLYAIPVPAEPKTTYSASVVGGGTSVNTIPAQVFLDVDIRSTSSDEVERVDRALQALARKAVEEENAARSIERGKVTVRFSLMGERPGGSTSELSGLAPLALAASRSFGYDAKYIAVSTDANIPMSLGIPAIGIGSGGKGGGEHSATEFIDVERDESVKGMSVALATLLGAAGM